MSNPLTIAREAIWAKLKADVALSSYITNNHGTYFDYATASKKLRDDEDVTKSDCPIVEMAPAPSNLVPSTNKSDDFEYVLAVNLYEAGVDVESIEELFWLVYKCLSTNEMIQFGVAGSEAPYLCNIRSISFPALWKAPEMEAQGLLWKASFLYSVFIRHKARI